jgi:hypothetical protein
VSRGTSATTVEAPRTSVQLGNSLVINGRVTDISSGTTHDQPAANFPDGVPVSSDSSLKDWMGYVYQQQSRPNNFPSVEVTMSTTGTRYSN